MAGDTSDVNMLMAWGRVGGGASPAVGALTPTVFVPPTVAPTTFLPLLFLCSSVDLEPAEWTLSPSAIFVTALQFVK